MNSTAVKLKDVCKSITPGANPVIPCPGPSQFSANFVTASAISAAGIIDPRSFSYVERDAQSRIKRTELRHNDIVLGVVPSGFLKAALVEEGFLPAFANGSLAILRANAEMLWPPFLRFFLLNIDGGGKSAKAGHRQMRLSIRQIRNFALLLPTLELQKRISSLIAPCDESIRENVRRIATLEGALQASFDNLISECPHALLVNETAKRAFGGLPPGWQIANFDDLVQARWEATDPIERRETYDVISLDCISEHSTIISERCNARDYPGSHIKVEVGDIVVGRISKRYCKIAIATQAALTGRLLVLSPKLHCAAIFTRFLMKTDQFVSLAARDSQRPKWNEIRNFRVALPPQTALQHFQRDAETRLQVCNALASSNQRLLTRRNVLLQRSLSLRS